MIELLTPAEMAEADRLAIAGGISGIELMENAGRAVADAAARLLAHGAPQVCVVAGPGNNGGDGFITARILAGRGYTVRVLLLGERWQLKGDAAIAACRWQGPVEAASPDGLAGAGFIIDALFGAGLDRPVEGHARAMIEAINASGAPILAVDLPSGTSGASGRVLGEAVRATRTITFFRKKPGHILLPGRLHCGPVDVADIGIPENVLEEVRPRVFANVPGLWAGTFPFPRIDGHKYTRGHAVVLSGAIASTGAARLAARGALRAGAGLVTIASPADALAVNAAANLSIMVRQVDDSAGLSALLADRRITAVVLGPGGGVGPRLREMVLAALATECAVVLDADALTSFVDEPEELFSAIKQRNCATILTPHSGEFARLFNKQSQAAENISKIEIARDAAAASGATIVLKGPDTVVAEPGGRVSIAENAPPWLATGGSGDVLAGIVSGLLTSGMSSFEAASAAVWLHGDAGNAVGPGLIAEDLPDALRGVYGQLFADCGTTAEPARLPAVP
jgi:ADP-dependent NAD(P)H-hydrate dehydratase / NAD(P)H-hydrate epimerase